MEKEKEMQLKEKLCKGVIPSEDSNEFRKVEKVVAPFLWTLKKRKREPADVLPVQYEELYLRRNPKEILTRLQTAFTDALEFRTLLNETAELLKVVTRSKNVNLYFTDYDRGELVLCPKYYQHYNRFLKKYTIESGTYLAAYVAFSKEYVISSDIQGDVRFPQGIPNVSTVKSVICLPIITNVKENCIGVIELYRECSDKPYDLTNLQICNALTAWMGIAVEQNAARLNFLKGMEAHRQLSNLAQLYFAGVIPFNKVVSDVIKLTKTVVNAEKAAFYVFREPVLPNSQHTLLADAYEEGVNEKNEMIMYKKRDRTSFKLNQPGIAGHAARTGRVINVHDAHRDHRFDKKTESLFHRTRSMLSFPIKNDIGVLAVMNLKNRLEYPHFLEEDIELIESFSYQITLICGHFLLNTAYTRTQSKLIIAEKLIDFYLKPHSDELNEIKSFLQAEQDLSPAFLRFELDTALFDDEALRYSAYILLCPDILEPCFDIQNLADFLLRVKKSYRPLFYHNFEHAFSVLHFVFNILMKNGNVYSGVETVPVLLAALCHDIDHTGLTNTFLSLQNDITYQLYGDFCGEIHRYELTLFLIQQTDLLSNFSSQNYRLVCRNLKKLIMAFDMAIHLDNRMNIMKLLSEGSFTWEDPEHRLMSQNMILFCSDYSFYFKSFEVVKKYTATFLKEMYKQGDFEKSMGFSPLPGLDRNKIDSNAENQLIWLTVIMLPVVRIVVKLFPKAQVLNDRLRHTMDKWNELIQVKGNDTWRVKEAIVRERKERRGTHKITLSSTLSSIRTIGSDTKSLKSIKF